MNAGQGERAVTMWFRGYDTYQIAQKLAVPESQVYNELPRLKEEHSDLKERVTNLHTAHQSSRTYL